VDVYQYWKIGSLVGSCRCGDIQVKAIVLVENIFRVRGNSRWEANESIFKPNLELRLRTFRSIEVRSDIFPR
jgi:hypothetical protein